MKRLNFVKFLGLLALLFVVGVGCDDEKEDTSLTSVYQTQWRGTYRGDNNFEREFNMIAFDTNTTGFYSYKEEGKNISADFRYNHEGNVIHILRGFGNALEGAWWIMKLTQSEMILQQYDPYSNVNTTLTLNRLY
ncbi:MAG: hypothetical protein RSB29_00875 [Alistipes sp.]